METVEKQLATDAAAAIKGAIDRGASGPFITLSKHHASTIGDSIVMAALSTLMKEVHEGAIERRHLEARVKVLEDEKYVDKGVWSGLEPYKVGDHVSDDGSEWACRVPHVSQRPGSEATKRYWRMVSKNGSEKERRLEERVRQLESQLKHFESQLTDLR